MKSKFLTALSMTVIIAALPMNVCAFGQERPISQMSNIQVFNMDDEYGGRYKLIKQIAVGIIIENRMAEVYAEASVYENANITVVAKLQQYKDFTWKTIATYEDSVEDEKECILVKNRPMTQGYDYRVVAEITVDDGTQTETVTKTSNTAFCD